MARGSVVAALLVRLWAVDPHFRSSGRWQPMDDLGERNHNMAPSRLLGVLPTGMFEVMPRRGHNNFHGWRPAPTAKELDEVEQEKAEANLEKDRWKERKEIHALSMLVETAKEHGKTEFIGGALDAAKDMANDFMSAMFSTKEIMPGDYPYMCMCNPPKKDEASGHVLGPKDQRPLCPADPKALDCWFSKETKELEKEMRKAVPGGGFAPPIVEVCHGNAAFDEAYPTKKIWGDDEAVYMCETYLTGQQCVGGTAMKGIDDTRHMCEWGAPKVEAAPDASAAAPAAEEGSWESHSWSLLQKEHVVPNTMKNLGVPTIAKLTRTIVFLMAFFSTVLIFLIGSVVVIALVRSSKGDG